MSLVIAATAAARGRTAQVAPLVAVGLWGPAVREVAAAGPALAVPSEAVGGLAVTLVAPRELASTHPVAERPLPPPVQVVGRARSMGAAAMVVQFVLVVVLTFLVGFGLFLDD